MISAGSRVSASAYSGAKCVTEIPRSSSSELRHGRRAAGVETMKHC